MVDFMRYGSFYLAHRRRYQENRYLRRSQNFFLNRHFLRRLSSEYL